MAEFIVKIHAKSIDAVDAILNKAIDAHSVSGVDGFYILVEDGKSLAHLHKEPHMVVERDEAKKIAFALKGREWESTLVSLLEAARVALRDPNSREQIASEMDLSDEAVKELEKLADNYPFLLPSV